MPVCPNCKSEYVEGITICADCGEKLVDANHLKEPARLSEDDWVIIYTTDYEYKAQLIKDNLEAAGIEAMVFSQKDRNFPAPGDFSVVKLLVRRDKAENALEFLEDNNIEDPDTDRGDNK